MSSIVLSGMVAADPHQGGATWAVLQYALGLRRLGHEVVLVDPAPPEAIRPHGAGLGESESAAYFRRVKQDFDLPQAALLLAGTQETVGISYPELRRHSRSADLLLNINGLLADEDLLAEIPVRVYLDIDAGFNQLWHATQGIDRRFAGHTHHVTIGLGIGEDWSPVPTCGIQWEKTLQPIVLSEWPVADGIVDDALTTVGNWRGYGSFEHEGVFYGQKAHSLRELIALPTRTDEQFLLALAIHPDETKDLDALDGNGWRLVDPANVAATPDAYRRFIQGSKAEFGLVKQGCVAAPCGWFSERSACYLASGRPVIAQETGFSRFLPTGEGLFAFTTEDQALVAIDALRGDYRRHADAARAIADEYFDSDRVLASLLERVRV
jgi:hypothetical protein